MNFPDRSPLLMSREQTALLMIDMQAKLVPHITDHERIEHNISRLIQAARLFDLPVNATEQYPQGLGGTIEPLAEQLKQTDEKTVFSCRECDRIIRSLEEQSIEKILVTGIESHVCVLQTVLDFIARGFDLYVCVDAIGSRNSIDHEIALRRMELSGATLVTTETAMFEWCETSTDDQFKAISKLVRQS